MSDSLQFLANKPGNGVGSKGLEKIKDAGFNSLKEIGSKSPTELSNEIEGVGFTTAVKILKDIEEKNPKYRDKNQENENLEHLIDLLKDLFYFDKEDQDFGVPKLMNQRRERLEQFIDEDLIETVHASIEEMEQNISESEVEEAREKVINEINEDAIKPNGKVAEEYKDSDISSVREVVENYQEKKEQAKEVEERENARAEVYNHIYQFFNRYYDKGDFITQRYRTQHEPPYSVPYDGSNTNFHWVTKNQYYAKTSEHYTHFSFSHEGFSYNFVTESKDHQGSSVGNSEYFVMNPSTLTISKQDEEIRVIFERRMIGQEDLTRCDISSSTGNKQSNMNEVFIQELSEKLRNEDVPFEQDQLESKLNEYTARNQSDFFIHKNLDSFLSSELEEYVKSEIVTYAPEDRFEDLSKIAIEKARAINEVSSKIISFLDQTEELKQKLFEKKKFVTDSSNIVPIGDISEDYYEQILSSDQQKSLWESSYDINTEDLTSEDLKQPPYNRMMVDTSLIDQAISSRTPKNKLIKGENYQALSLLEEKYREAIKAIYIDPPYNTDNPSFAYKDSYERPTWLSMMSDRLKASKKLLDEKGAVFISIDYNELPRLRNLCDEIFGEQNHVATFVWRRRAGGANDAQNNMSTDHEYIVVYSKSDKFKMNGIEKDFDRYSNPDDDPRGPWTKGDLTCNKTKDQRPNLYFPIEDPETGRVFECNPDRVWRYNKETMQKYIEEGKVIFPEDDDRQPARKRFKSEVKSNYKPISSWIETTSTSDKEIERLEEKFGSHFLRTGLNSSGTRSLANIFDRQAYDYPKPVELIKSLLEQVIEDSDDIILDFFAGSGTTAEAVMEINRERDENVNYILVELLDKAFNVTEERIKRVAYSAEWDDGIPQVEENTNLQDFDGSSYMPGAVERIELESYEDALDSVDFGEEQSGLSQHTDYLLNYMLDFETVSASLMKTGVDRENDIFSKPLEYKLNRDAQKDTTADLMTTFNYLLGLRKVEYEQKEIEGTDYSVYRGVMDDDEVLIIWRHDASEVEDYETEREEFDAEDYDHIYVNGDSAISGAKLISSAFKRKMFGGE